MIKTEELYNQWNNTKKKIEFSTKINKKYPLIWEFWICKVWINIWSECSKNWDFQRPALIIVNNLWWDLVWILPSTTKFKEKYSKFYYKVENYKDYWLDKETYILLNQFKILSSKRLIKKINNIFANWKHIKKLDIENLKEIKEIIRKIYKL